MADKTLDLLNQTQIKLLQKYDGAFSRLDSESKRLVGVWQSTANNAKRQIDITNKTVNDKIKWADTQIKNFISKAHVSKTFKVGGDRRHFYPIVFTTNYQPFRFFITRDSVHWDGNWYGRCIIEIEGLTTHWGHGANYTRVVTNNHYRTRYLSRAYEEYETGWIVLYLRGNTTYRFISNWANVNLADYSTKNKRWTWSRNKNEWIEFRVVADGAKTTYQDRFKVSWVKNFSKGGCYGVSRKGGGRIIDTNHL